MKYFVTSRLSENMHLTPEGFLLCIGVPIARVGEMLYGEGETPLESDEDGKVIVLRDEDEVFRAETLASFHGKPVTIGHPTEFVDPQNWSDLAKGSIQNPRRGEGEQEDDVVADLLITDAMAIGLIKQGLREVSCGYEADYVQMEKGKGKQTNIIGNHLALVEQGRAGPSYAINDHKGAIKMKKKKLLDQVKTIFGKAQDEAAKVLDEGAEVTSENEKVGDADALDELKKLVKDLGSKVDAMGKSKDAEGEEKPAPKKLKEKEEKTDDEGEESSGIEDRLKALETAVAKLLEMESSEAGDEDEDGEEAESEDDDFEETTMTGDAKSDVASRAEILAPGIAITKNVKAQALKAAYGTKDGKKAIHALTGGKAPTFDSAEKVNVLFIAASELLKASRTGELSKTRDSNEYQSTLGNQGPMSAEKMNQLNDKFYKRN